MDVWAHGFIDAPLIPDDLKDVLSDNMVLSNKLAELHDLLLPWALDQQHPSAQSKLHGYLFLTERIVFFCFLGLCVKICTTCSTSL